MRAQQFARAGLTVIMLVCCSLAGAVEPLSPCGLVADGGNERVYLEWNPSTFDQVVGYRIYRTEAGAEAKPLTPEPVSLPKYVDEAVANGTEYAYTITGVLKDGRETPHSNTASATPAETENPRRRGFGFVFSDGQEIAFDRKTMKLISWKTADGEELALPTIYGRPVYLTSFDPRGLSFPEPATPERPVMTTPISKDYDTSRGHGKHLPPDIQDGRVQFFYRLPLGGYGGTSIAHDSWIWASVWETWWPVERKIGPTVYRGIARRIELDVPSVYRDGFQLNLNDAFGFDGSCKDAVSYRAFSWGSRMSIIHWDPDTDAAEIGAIRTSYGRPFHPDQNVLNVHPFLFVDHPKGTLLFTAQRQFYAIHAALSNYAAQGKDGLWPNFAVDLDNPGRRFTVDTFEYLYSPDRTLQAPQRYLDARFHYLRRMAHLYGHPTEFPGASVGLRRNGYKRDADALAEGQAEGKRLAAEGIDLRHDVHSVWFNAPFGFPELLHNPDAPANKAVAAYNAGLKQHGVVPGFWFRPETVTTSRGNILSEHFWTPYHVVPWLMPSMEERGLPLLRENPHWIRRCRDGLYPDELGINPELMTAYNWTPMSLKGGWYDQVLYPAFEMAGKLGFKSIFFDGGFGGFTGVEYVDGRAVAMQPYYHRLLRTASHFGLAAIGECGIGAGVLFCFGPSGEDKHGRIPWMFAGCPLMQDGPSGADDWMHRLHQLYTMPFSDRGAAPRAHAFAREFVEQHGAPRRIVLDGLRLQNPPGEQDRWVYDRVFWEYADGRRVEYPNELPTE